MKSALTVLGAIVMTASLSASPYTRSFQTRGIETGSLEVSGGKLYYEVSGAGQTIVLIHGGFGDRRMWDDQFQAFARSFRVIRYDHRGFGGSSVPLEAYSPVADLERLLDHLGVKRAHLVGNSMGGGVALDFALRLPDKVASLVLVATGANGLHVSDQERESVLKIFKAGQEQGVEKAAELWLVHPMVAVTSRTPGVRDRLEAMVRDNSRIFLMRFWPSEPLDPPAAERLAEVSIPTLMVVGESDTPLVRRLADATALGIRGAVKIEIKGADHLPQMCRPTEFNNAVLKFLREF